MPEYRAPGVYMEERDDGPKPIEGVGTAMPVFIGFTEKAEREERRNGSMELLTYPNKPELVTSWNQYVQKFGDFVDGTYLPIAVYGYFLNGGTRCYVVSVTQFARAAARLVNGAGEEAIIVRARRGSLKADELRVKVEVVVALPEADKVDPATPVPDPTFNLTIRKPDKDGQMTVIESIRNVKVVQQEREGKTIVTLATSGEPARLVELEVVGEPKTLADLFPTNEQDVTIKVDDTKIKPAKTTDFQGSVKTQTGIEALEALDDVTMVSVPDLMTALKGKLDETVVKSVQELVISHCTKMQDRVAILDVPNGKSPQDAKSWRKETTNFDSSYAALYYPWIKVNDPITNEVKEVPPSGHIAGIWARNDITRGVHKAPANEVVRGAVGLAYNMTKGEQEVLNPEGVNCIRAFPGMGIRVWGARTLSSNPSWRYLNVRRLFNYAEKSIERGTQWVVFEPNDHRLWGKVRRDVTAFLLTMWRDGMLFGLSPEEAFFVRCDETTNPRESRDLGRLIVEIGMAPVKPAEFVIFRISQWAGPGAEE
jgi:hypothetical protein